MNILYVGYWGANEGLSQATINPHLIILSKNPEIKKIHYISIERNDRGPFLIPNDSKIIHHPYFSKGIGFRLLIKFIDILGVFFLSRRLIGRESIDFIICRSSLAGVIGYYLHELIGKPYAVESFEPHGEYMKELGIWSRFGISYLLQSYWENCQKRTANLLMPVTFNYSKKLINEGIEKSRLQVMPCAVNADIFKYEEQDRLEIRSKHNLGENVTVGIYVGKFGGLYLDEEAFEIFNIAKRLIPSFYLFILSPMPGKVITDKLLRHGFRKNEFFIDMVSHEEVPKYLSGSDFAFCFHKPLPIMSYVSPIKNGEYWACGLPILMPKGIGDDFNFISQFQFLGTNFNLDKKSISHSLINILLKINNRSLITEKGISLRNFSFVNRAYQKLLMKQFDV
jgi:hypothetical protein